MSTHASALPTTSLLHARRVRWARTLSCLSIAWMAIEAALALVAALLAGSVALLGFGLDSLIELASASVIIWRFTGARTRSESAERHAQRLIAACLVFLALYLCFTGIKALVDGSQPDVSWLGAAVSAGALIVMPLLAQAKNRVATELGSAATAGDAAQSLLCAIAGAGVLASIVAHAAFGWWWLDPIVGLAIAAIAVHEARETWAGDTCVDCAPIGFDPSA